jgi:hypothetical protein
MEDTNFALKVSPAEALEFTLSRDGGSGEKEVPSRCIMTLSHPNNSNVHLAYKVKTTQPRRYLVRPNQGIVAPGETATVNILLVDKDKQMLLQSYDRLGQSALDHSKDKFLVQSCVVNDDFAKNYLAQKRVEDRSSSTSSSSSTKVARELGESLTAMWNSVSSSEDTQIYNKKLQVRHVVSETGRSARAATTQLSDKTSLENMTPEQMFMEISSLRRKYDELVTFSVNLTAERDILNNTLEQTKRDLNREIANRGKSVSSGAGVDAKKGGGVSFIFTLFLALFFFLMGVKLTQMNKIDFLMNAPVFGNVLKMEL